MKHLTLGVAALAGVVGMTAGAARAGPVFGFTRITDNGSVDVASQLSVEVNPAMGGRQVDFTFRNTGTQNATISGVYFDDGTLLNIATLMEASPGVTFMRGAAPPELPGGDAVDFNTSASLSAAAETMGAGVGAGEFLTIRFDLIMGQSPVDTLGALALGMANPGNDVENGLRIGLLVALDEGQIDSFINAAEGPVGGGGQIIPLPSAAAMGMAGLFGVAGRRRRRRGA